MAPATPCGQQASHTVHAVLECPPIANGQFMLINRTTKLAEKVLAVGDLDQDAPTLNLARLRYLSANLGTALANIDVLFSPSPLVRTHRRLGFRYRGDPTGRDASGLRFKLL